MTLNPMDTQCPLGSENKANIDANRRMITDFRGETRDSLMQLKADMALLSNQLRTDFALLTTQFSGRPQWFVSIIITTLVSMLVGLVMYILKT